MSQPTDKLYFFAGSADKPPGNGAKEHARNPAAYAALPRGWRKVLSNFHECAFRWKGKRWKTIEHAFQATKIALVDPRKAALFSLDSESALAHGDGKAARRERKMEELRGGKLVAWNVMSGDVMAQIATAKYAQCPEARRVLLATGKAQLWHAAPRMAAVRFHHLERIRARLRSTRQATAARKIEAAFLARRR